MRDQGASPEDLPSTPYHSKVYTDTPATRSPILTVVLAIVILAILTFGALALLKWYQRRSAELRHSPFSRVATRNRLFRSDSVRDDIAGSFNVWKSNYE